jgi:hypothetical protein
MTTQRIVSRLTLGQILGVLYFLGTTLLALVILLLVGAQLRTQYREDLLSANRQVAERLVQDSRLALIQRTVENVRSALEMARSFPDVEAIAIYTSDGKPLVGSVPATIMPNDPDATDLTETGVQVVWENEWQMVLAAPVIFEPAQRYGFSTTSSARHAF